MGWTEIIIRLIYLNELLASESSKKSSILTLGPIKRRDLSLFMPTTFYIPSNWLTLWNIVLVKQKLVYFWLKQCAELYIRKKNQNIYSWERDIYIPSPLADIIWILFKENLHILFELSQCFWHCYVIIYDIFHSLKETKVKL